MFVPADHSATPPVQPPTTDKRCAAGRSLRRQYNQHEGLLNRRMNVRDYHQATKVLESRSVQVQRHHCCPADWSFADDFRRVIAPPEVVTPFVTPRVKKRHCFSRDRIHACGFCSLVPIAALTGKSAVIQFIRTALAARDNVFGGIRAGLRPTGVRQYSQRKRARSARERSI